ncbi:MAG TPA: hypothetical protein VF624_06080 [Tepidisphaeraceae bacterium]|jgi:hypothetical protein
MSNAFNTVCDDFYVNLRVGTQMPLPSAREALLHFFEQIQKAFPDMTRFRRGESEYAIEEDRDRDSYRWLSLEPQRLSCGQVNPETIDTALRLHRTVLEQAPYALGLSRIEIDYVDLLLGFDLEFTGNHDDVVAESLYADSPMASLMEEEGAKPVDFQPSVTVALTSDMRLQARVDVVTRSNASHGHSGEGGGDVISVYLIVRRFFGDRVTEPLEALLGDLADRAENLAHKYVVPKIVQPLRTAIASRS